MKTLALAALALLLPAFAAAQNDGAPAQAPAAAPSAVQKDRAAVDADRRDLARDRAGLKDGKAQLRALTRQETAARADLRAKEKAAVDAVRADSALTEAQKKARIKAIHRDYRSQRRSLDAEYSGKKQALRDGVRKDSSDARRDRARMKTDSEGLRQDRRAGGAHAAP